ncbi:hypothetical protein ABK040_012280 [Willaertia magna]
MGIEENDKLSLSSVSLWNDCQNLYQKTKTKIIIENKYRPKSRFSVLVIYRINLKELDPTKFKLTFEKPQLEKLLYNFVELHKGYLSMAYYLSKPTPKRKLTSLEVDSVDEATFSFHNSDFVEIPVYIPDLKKPKATHDCIIPGNSKKFISFHVVDLNRKIQKTFQKNDWQADEYYIPIYPDSFYKKEQKLPPIQIIEDFLSEEENSNSQSSTIIEASHVETIIKDLLIQLKTENKSVDAEFLADYFEKKGLLTVTSRSGGKKKQNHKMKVEKESVTKLTSNVLVEKEEDIEENTIAFINDITMEDYCEVKPNEIVTKIWEFKNTFLNCTPNQFVLRIDENVELDEGERSLNVDLVNVLIESYSFDDPLFECNNCYQKKEFILPELVEDDYFSLSVDFKTPKEAGVYKFGFSIESTETGEEIESVFCVFVVGN